MASDRLPDTVHGQVEYYTAATHGAVHVCSGVKLALPALQPPSRPGVSPACPHRGKYHPDDALLTHTRPPLRVYPAPMGSATCFRSLTTDLTPQTNLKLSHNGHLQQDHHRPRPAGHRRRRRCRVSGYGAVSCWRHVCRGGAAWRGLRSFAPCPHSSLSSLSTARGPRVGLWLPTPLSVHSPGARWDGHKSSVGCAMQACVCASLRTDWAVFVVVLLCMLVAVADLVEEVEEVAGE